MVALPQLQVADSHPPQAGCGRACGTDCGAGLENIYPTTAVRWGAMNWLGEFAYKPGTVFRCGAKVVIATERGTELGQQVSLFCTGCSKSVSREQVKQYIDTSGPEFYKLGSGRILREATAQDIAEQQKLNANVLEDIDRCALLAAQLQLDMKVVTAEHLLGGERIVFYFRAEQRVDFRELVRELARHYRTRIELRQVGARDEARLVADYEICGRECCCKNFLKKLRPVSMRMAKLQKSTLDPTKLSGRCGRLRCCLRYEHEGYEALEKKLPRVGSRVATDFGAATVVDRQILTQLVLVRTDDQRERAIPVEEIRAFDLPKPAPAPGSEAAEPLRRASPRTADAPALQRRPPDSHGPSQERAADSTLPIEAPEIGRADLPPAPPARPDAAAPEPAPSLPSRRRRRRRRRRGPQAPDPPAAPGA